MTYLRKPIEMKLPQGRVTWTWRIGREGPGHKPPRYTVTYLDPQAESERPASARSIPPVEVPKQRGRPAFKQEGRSDRPVPQPDRVSNPARQSGGQCLLPDCAGLHNTGEARLSPVILGRDAADLCPHLVARRDSIGAERTILHCFQILFQLLQLRCAQNHAIGRRMV